MYTQLCNLKNLFFVLSLSAYLKNKHALSQGETGSEVKAVAKPVLQNQASGASLQKKPSNIGLGNQPSILLVEDTQIAQVVTKCLLEKLGYQVAVADCGFDALNLYAPGKFDLIFMDIGLPDISGTVVAKKIRDLEQKNGFYVPIIAVTAHATEEVVAECIDKGIDEIMHKPLTTEKAQELISRYVQNSNTDGLSITKQAMPDESNVNSPIPIIESTVNRDMLNSLINVLDEFRSSIKLAKQQKDMNTLANVVHKLHGGTCYSGTPRIQKVANLLELALKQDPFSEESEKLYQQLMQEIDAVQKMYNTMY